MKKSKLAVARGAMHDARHAENTLRDNYRKAKKAADEFRREAIALCAEKESWIFERSKLIKQRDDLLAALRRSYIELFYCNQQLTGVLDEDGVPFYRTGKTVSDSLEESKSLLESIDRVKGSAA